MDKKSTSAAEMHTNKVFQVLEHLEHGENKRLLKFLNSPYFNQSRTLVQLCEIFLALIENNQKGFKRETVWRKLFQKETYDDVNFRKYCSDLLKLVENFMAQEMLMQEPVRQAVSTLEFVVHRRMEPLYNSAFRQARSEMQKQKYRTHDYFHNAYLIERLYYSMMDFDVKVNVRANLEEISHNLDIYYWIEKIKLHSSALSQRKTGNYLYQIDFIDQIIAYLQQYPREHEPELSLYYYAFLTLYEENNTDHYYKLREMLAQFGTNMPQKEAIELYDSALHYSTGKINKGNRIFLQEYFDLSEEAIQKNIFLMKNELAPWRFNNITVAALRLGKLDWAENFVTQYHLFLPQETRQNTYTFNLARVYFYQHKFEKVLGLLRNIEYEDIGYNLISKVNLTLTYYELDEFDALDSFMESFRVFLNRHKNIPLQRRRSYLNLLKYVRRLTRLLPGDKPAVEKLREEVVLDKAVTVNHEWLLEKLEELG